MSHEAHQDGQQADDAVHALHGRLRRMSGVLPVSLQDFLHGGQPALCEVRRGNRHSPSRLREGLFLCVCPAYATQTLSCAKGRTLICLNTCGLLKRAALERKKPAGGETHALLTCSTRVRLGASYHINSVFVDYGDEHDGFPFFSRSIAGCPRR